MLIPILFVIGFALVGLKVGQKLAPSDFRVGAALPMPRPRPVSYLAMVNGRLRRNLPVSEWLQTEAIREAFDNKDWEAVKYLTDLFDPDTASQEQAKENDDSQKPAAPDTSPLDGVELDDWQTFVEALSTKPTGHKSERHVGRFEQNLSRLRQLGIEAPISGDEEYKALVADMTDYWDSESSLIQESAGEVVKLGGDDVPVTPSGILGLLKAAGSEGARSWLANEEDRKRFPKTTETFTRTNGCF